MQSYVHKIENFMERDWLEDIKSIYFHINPVYRHSFWILFIVTNIVFGFHTINFLWGNHDWSLMVNGQKWNGSFWEGRYGTFIVSQLLTKNLYLPIISALWAYVALSLSAILLAIYWKVPQKTAYFVIFGLILNITPYTLSWMWYTHWTVNIFFGRLFIITSFLLSNKFTTGTIKQKIYGNLLIIFLLNFGLGIYQSYIGTFVMILIGRILVEMLDWNTLKNGIYNSIKQYTIIIIDIVLAVVLYKVVLKYMEYKNIIREGFYNMQTTSLTNIFPKALSCIKAAWIQFTDFSIPFYPNILTKLFFILAIIFIVQILIHSKKSIIMKLAILGVFFIALFFTKIVAFISSMDFIVYASRIDFCGYVLFNALIIVLCLKTGGIIQNIKILISLLIIYLFIVNDLHQQRTFKLGFDSERMVWSRVWSRIENSASFKKDNKYEYIQIGNWPVERLYFYPKNDKIANKDEELLYHLFIPRWLPYITFSFYNHLNIKKNHRINKFSNSAYMLALKRIYNAGLLENAHAWPSENSIIVYEDIILVITEEKDLQKAKQLLAKQIQKEKTLEEKSKANHIITTPTVAETQ